LIDSKILFSNFYSKYLDTAFLKLFLDTLVSLSR
jgi:hypothetical protein